MHALARLVVSICMLTGPAFAQSEMPDDAEGADDPTADRFVIPPDALSNLRRDRTARAVAPKPEAATTVPEVIRDVSALPAPVARTRDRILKAARSGDIEALRPLLGTGDTATQLAFGALETDPISFLLAASGDPEGHELMAILLEVLEAGFVRIDDAEDGVMFLWPYFAAYPIDALEPKMKVELFRLLTGGDYEDMQEFGAYIFYRIGIGEDGTWRFFLSGDG